MKKTQAISALLPLVAFYAIEAYYGLTAGLIVAMAMSAMELAWHWFKHGRLDRMVLMSAGLIFGLGGLSLISEDERFILYSPAIGDLVFATILGVSVWRGKPLLQVIAAERDPSLVEDPIRADFLSGITARLALNLALHGAVAAWSAGRSRAVWLFVSGPLQYVFLGAQMLFELLWARLVVLPRLEAWEDAQALRGSDAPQSFPPVTATR